MAAIRDTFLKVKVAGLLAQPEIQTLADDIFRDVTGRNQRNPMYQSDLQHYDLFSFCHVLSKRPSYFKLLMTDVRAIIEKLTVREVQLRFASKEKCYVRGLIEYIDRNCTPKLQHTAERINTGKRTNGSTYTDQLIERISELFRPSFMIVINNEWILADVIGGRTSLFVTTVMDFECSRHWQSQNSSSDISRADLSLGCSTAEHNPLDESPYKMTIEMDIDVLRYINLFRSHELHQLVDSCQVLMDNSEYHQGKLHLVGLGERRVSHVRNATEKLKVYSQSLCAQLKFDTIDLLSVTKETLEAKRQLLLEVGRKRQVWIQYEDTELLLCGFQDALEDVSKAIQQALKLRQFTRKIMDIF